MEVEPGGDVVQLVAKGGAGRGASTPAGDLAGIGARDVLANGIDKGADVVEREEGRAHLVPPLDVASQELEG